MVGVVLVPNEFYWAKSPKFFDGHATIVQVSTVFGKHPDYWTLALPGTDQHAMPTEFEIIAQVAPLEAPPHRLAAE